MKINELWIIQSSSKTKKKCIADTPCCGQFAKLKNAKIDFL